MINAHLSLLLAAALEAPEGVGRAAAGVVVVVPEDVVRHQQRPVKVPLKVVLAGVQG